MLYSHIHMCDVLVLLGLELTIARGVSFNHFNQFFEKASKSSEDHQNDHENDRLMMSVVVMR